MKIPYKNELNELIRWISNANAIIGSSRQITHLVQEVQQVTRLITVVSNGIQEEYPFYSKLLPEVASRLFMNFMGSLRLNTAAFGELAVIIRHINEEPIDLKLWENIHPRIQKISKGLYVDAYYDSAAEKAIKEVETRLREKFKEYPGFTVLTGKFEDMVFEDNVFDLVFSASAFHWVPEKIGYEKAYAMLKSGGAFARFANTS